MIHPYELATSVHTIRSHIADCSACVAALIENKVINYFVFLSAIKHLLWGTWTWSSLIKCAETSILYRQKYVEYYMYFYGGQYKINCPKQGKVKNISKHVYIFLIFLSLITSLGTNRTVIRNDPVIKLISTTNQITPI